LAALSKLGAAKIFSNERDFMQSVKLISTALLIALAGCSKEPKATAAASSLAQIAEAKKVAPPCDASSGMANVKELIAGKIILNPAGESRARETGFLKAESLLKERWLQEKDDVIDAMKMDLVVPVKIDDTIAKRWCSARVTIPQHTQFPITVEYSFQLSPTEGTVTALTFDNGISGPQGINLAVSYMDTLLKLVFSSEIRAMHKSSNP
jgi:hypothetical protein